MLKTARFSEIVVEGYLGKEGIGSKQTAVWACKIFCLLSNEVDKGS